MLNSNEQLELDDSFNLSFVDVCRPPTGTGRNWTYLPGHQASPRLKQLKRCPCLRRRSALCPTGHRHYLWPVDELHRQKRQLEQIRNGGKVLQLTYDVEVATDSISFFAMPFSDFPENFRLTELKKGFFPHLFNTPDHQLYLDLIPEQKYYTPEWMKIEN